MRRRLTGDAVKLRAVGVREETLVERTRADRRWSSNAGPAARGKSVERLEVKRDNWWSWMFVPRFWGESKGPSLQTIKSCICQELCVAEFEMWAVVGQAIVGAGRRALGTISRCWPP